MPEFRMTKTASAFYPRATASVSGVVAVGPAVYAAKKALGGLWVGGMVTISDDGVHFAPNGLNRFLHKKADAIHIPLASVNSVTIDGGWVTRIVSVLHEGGEFRLRCYGAAKLADALNKQLASRRG